MTVKLTEQRSHLIDIYGKTASLYLRSGKSTKLVKIYDLPDSRQIGKELHNLFVEAVASDLRMNKPFKLVYDNSIGTDAIEEFSPGMQMSIKKIDCYVPGDIMTVIPEIPYIDKCLQRFFPDIIKKTAFGPPPIDEQEIDGEKVSLYKIMGATYFLTQPPQPPLITSIDFPDFPVDLTPDIAFRPSKDKHFDFLEEQCAIYLPPIDHKAKELPKAPSKTDPESCIIT